MPRRSSSGASAAKMPPRVATRADLAHDDQLRRIRVERVADQLVDDVGPVELRGVDVIDPAVDRLAQHRDRFPTIARRPEHVGAGQPHRTEPHGRDRERTERSPARIGQGLRASVS